MSDERREMVAVDWPSAANAGEVASVLSRSGLHLEYDDRPLNAVKGRSFAKTAIYVPDTEAPEAREVLATWYAARQRHILQLSKGMWRGLAPPFMIAIACGAVFVAISGDIVTGLAVAFIAFIPAVAVWHPRRG